MDTMEIRTIVVCKGIPGSGKSTWSIEQLRKYPGKYKRVNRDSIREMLDGGKFDWDNENFVESLRDIIIDRALRKGFDVIVDDTNLKDSVWEKICDIAKKVGNVRVMERYFEVTLKDALQRNSERYKKVPEDVIEAFFEKYIKGRPIEVRDEFFPITIPEFPLWDHSKIDAIIVDIDGTLAIGCLRSPYDMTKILDDIPNKHICELVRVFSKTYKVIIVSGREDCARKDTELWLKVNDVPFDIMYMRVTGDNRKDAIIKEEIYNEHIKPYYNVRYVLDDRKQVVDKWRSLDLCCLQVADGDF